MRCDKCGQTIPDWVKEQQIIANGGTIIGFKRGENGGEFVYYEPIPIN